MPLGLEDAGLEVGDVGVGGGACQGAGEDVAGLGWVDQGATIVGGCCEIGPDHIREIARRLTEAGHEIV